MKKIKIQIARFSTGDIKIVDLNKRQDIRKIVYKNFNINPGKNSIGTTNLTISPYDELLAGSYLLFKFTKDSNVDHFRIIKEPNENA